MKEENYTPISRIQHFSFCKRQWALIDIENQWAENFLTYSGNIMHKKADSPFIREKRRDTLISRSMPLVSHKYQITGIADVVEFQKNENGTYVENLKECYAIFPVEYKRGRKKENNCDKLQLLAQAICLEEMFKTVILKGFLYYGETKKREEVVFTEELKNELIDVLQEMSYFKEHKITPPPIYNKKCSSCSLNLICVPRLKASNKKYLDEIYD